MALAETITQKLTETLEADHVEIVDNTWMHAGHAGAATGGSHLKVTVVSPKFENIPLMEQHRMVHQLLKGEMATVIHALELKTMTPSAWEKTNAKL